MVTLYLGVCSTYRKMPKVKGTNAAAQTVANLRTSNLYLFTVLKRVIFVLVIMLTYETVMMMEFLTF